jgi:hypothetical protein
MFSSLINPSLQALHELASPQSTQSVKQDSQHQIFLLSNVKEMFGDEILDEQIFSSSQQKHLHFFLISCNEISSSNANQLEIFLDKHFLHNEFFDGMITNDPFLVSNVKIGNLNKISASQYSHLNGLIENFISCHFFFKSNNIFFMI